MLKLALISLLLIAALLYIAETKISFSPFKVQFGKGWFALGWLLIVFGMALVRYQGYKDGMKRGIDCTFRYLKQEMDKKENRTDEQA